MEKEGGALVDRPPMIAADILSGGMRLLLESSGDRFRRLKRVVHTHLQPKSAKTYEDIQAETAKDVILNILNDPEQHVKHAQRYVSKFTHGSSWVLGLLFHKVYLVR